MIEVHADPSRRMGWLLVLAVFALVALGSWWLVSRDLPTRRVVELRIEPEVVFGAGELRAAEPVVVAAAVDGVVSAVHVKPGEALTQNELLIELRNPQIARDADVASLACAAAQASVQAQQLENRAQAKQLVSERVLAQQEMELAEAELAAREALVERSVIAALDVARARASAARAASSLALASEREQAQPQIDQARLEAAQAAAALSCAQSAHAKELASALRVLSPLSGEMADVRVSLGSPVSRGQPLADVHDGRIEAELGVVENAARSLRAGLIVELSSGELRLRGTIVRMIPTSEAGLVKVRVAFEDHPAELRAGALISASMATGLNRKLWVIDAVAGLAMGSLAVERERNGHRTSVTLRVREGPVEGIHELIGEIEEGDVLQFQVPAS